MSELDIEALKRRQLMMHGPLVTLTRAELAAVIDALEDHERLRELLLKWGCHMGTCTINEDPIYECTCGWEEIRAALEGSDD